jgi:hypothetical protein
MGQSGSGDTQGQCRLDSAWGEALAWSADDHVTHIALQEEQGNPAVKWMEKVTYEQYKPGK